MAESPGVRNPQRALPTAFSPGWGGAWSPSLRKYPAFRVGLADALQRDAHRRHAPVALLGRRVLADLQVGALHSLGEALLDLLEVPALGPLVLQPLVVADDDAAGVRQDVRDDVDVLLAEDRLG